MEGGKFCLAKREVGEEGSLKKGWGKFFFGGGGLRREEEGGLYLGSC